MRCEAGSATLATCRGKSLEQENGRAGMEPARPLFVSGCSGRESWWSVSAGPDGERVKVVGEDAPACPGALAFVSLQAAAAQAVAAL